MRTLVRRELGSQEKFKKPKGLAPKERRKGVLKILLKAAKEGTVQFPKPLVPQFSYVYYQGKLVLFDGKDRSVHRTGWIGERRINELLGLLERDRWPDEDDTNQKRAKLAKLVDKMARRLTKNGWTPLIAAV